jgi:hypothetical protein
LRKQRKEASAMSETPIRETTKLMEEQASCYAQLDFSCTALCDALIQGEPAAIESLTRKGEAELFPMRARLVRIVRALTIFAEARALAPETSSLSPEVRTAFEAASESLLHAARSFQRTRARAAALTTSGATFATACIEVCGIPPTTYRGPYARNAEVRPWA